MHPAIAKAQKLGRIAKENGWTGTIQSECFDTERITTIKAIRDEELIVAIWHGNTMSMAQHHIFGHITKLSCAKAVLERLEGWPDVMDIISVIPVERRPDIVPKYVRLPFDWQVDSSEEIIEILKGRKIFWYNRIDGHIESDVVMVPKGKAKKNKIEVKKVGHRRMFNFVSATTGFRSVMLDQMLKVA